MIRERREQDLDPLCAVLHGLGHPAAGVPDDELRAWLEERDAELSWVYDMAPVSVAPTRNVVAHVEIVRPGDRVVRAMGEVTERPADHVLAIGKLFVKHSGYEHGIARHLLKQSVRYIQAQGKVAVVDQEPFGFLTPAFFARYGFRAVPSTNPDAYLVLHTG